MFKKNMTDSASTVWPSANFQPFIWMVTVLLPLEYFGRFPVEIFGWTAALLPSPKKYRGRNINIWNCVELATEQN